MFRHKYSVYLHNRNATLPIIIIRAMKLIPILAPKMAAVKLLQSPKLSQGHTVTLTRALEESGGEPESDTTTGIENSPLSMSISGWRTAWVSENEYVKRQKRKQGVLEIKVGDFSSNPDPTHLPEHLINFIMVGAELCRIEGLRELYGYSKAGFLNFTAEFSFNLDQTHLPVTL